MKNILLLYLALIHIHFAQGQVIQYEKVFNYDYFSFGEAIIQLPGEGYIVGGAIIDTLSISKSNLFLMRTDKFGDTIWSKHYDIGNLPLNWGNTVKKINMQPNGDIIVFGIADFTVIMLKTDSLGNIKWIKNYSRYSRNLIGDVYFASDNSFVLGMESDSALFTGTSKRVVMKIDTSGTILWKNYFSRDSVLIRGITEINNSYYVLLQDHSSLSNGLDIVQISSNGYYLNSFKWDFNNYPSQPKLIKKDNIYLSVVCSFTNASNGNLLLFKSDTLGNIFWNKSFTNVGLNGNSSPKMVETNDSGFAIVTELSGCVNPYIISLIKTDDLGDTLWTKAYGIGDENHPGDLIQSADSGYVIVGNYGDPLGMIKTSSLGNSGCNYYCPNIIIDTTSISLMTNSYITYNDTIYSSVLSGIIYSGIYENVICASVGLEEFKNDTSTLVIYPNPTSTTLIVKLNRNESITISNLLGEVLQKQTFAKGTINLDISFLSTGIYLLNAGNEVRKFVKE